MFWIKFIIKSFITLRHLPSKTLIATDHPRKILKRDAERLVWLYQKMSINNEFREFNANRICTIILKNRMLTDVHLLPIKSIIVDHHASSPKMQRKRVSQNINAFYTANHGARKSPYNWYVKSAMTASFTEYLTDVCSQLIVVWFKIILTKK